MSRPSVIGPDPPTGARLRYLGERRVGRVSPLGVSDFSLVCPRL